MTWIPSWLNLNPFRSSVDPGMSVVVPKARVAGDTDPQALRAALLAAR